MTSTTVERSFEVKVYEQGEDVGGTVDFTISADMLASPLEIGGSTARLADGTSESMPYAVRFRDPLGTITPQLWDGNGVLHVIGRVVEVVLTENGSPGTVDVRRIGTVRSASPTIIELHLIDEAAFDRTTLFARNPTIQVALMGPDPSVNNWAGVAYIGGGVTGTTTATIVGSSGDFRQVGIGTGSEATGRGQFEAILQDVVDSPSGSNTTGNFKSLIFQIDGVDRPITSFGALSASNPNTIVDPDAWDTGSPGRKVIPDAWVYWPGGPGSGTVLNSRIHFGNGEGPPTAPAFPYLIEEPGIRDLFTAVMDGTYGGSAMRFNLPSTSDLPNNLIGAISLAIPGPIERRILLAAIAKFAGVVLWLDEMGRISPRPWPVPPIGDLSGAELAALYRFDGATALGAPTYDVKHSSAANVWRAEGISVVAVGGTSAIDAESPFAQDVIFPATLEEDETGSSPITSDPLVFAAGMEGLVLSAGLVGSGSVAEAYLAATLGGLAEGRIRGHATSDAPLPGELVIFDHDDLKGLNPATGARSGEQLARVVDRRRVYQGAEVYYDYRVIFGGVA